MQTETAHVWSCSSTGLCWGVANFLNSFFTPAFIACREQQGRCPSSICIINMHVSSESTAKTGLFRSVLLLLDRYPLNRLLGMDNERNAAALTPCRFAASTCHLSGHLTLGRRSIVIAALTVFLLLAHLPLLTLSHFHRQSRRP